MDVRRAAAGTARENHAELHVALRTGELRAAQASLLQQVRWKCRQLRSAWRSPSRPIASACHTSTRALASVAQSPAYNLKCQLEGRTRLPGRDVRAKQLRVQVVRPFACLGRQHASARALGQARSTPIADTTMPESPMRATPADVDRARMPDGATGSDSIAIVTCLPRRR